MPSSSSLAKPDTEEAKSGLLVTITSLGRPAFDFLHLQSHDSCLSLTLPEDQPSQKAYNMFLRGGSGPVSSEAVLMMSLYGH